MTLSKVQLKARASKAGKIGGKAKVKKGFAMLSKEELIRVARIIADEVIGQNGNIDEYVIEDNRKIVLYQNDLKAEQRQRLQALIGNKEELR